MIIMIRKNTIFGFEIIITIVCFQKISSDHCLGDGIVSITKIVMTQKRGKKLLNCQAQGQ